MANARAILEALGDPSRRLIAERLVSGPLPVGVLAAALPLSRPAVSQHLKVLKEAGIVQAEASGTRRLYRLDLDGLGVLRQYLDGLERQALAGGTARHGSGGALDPPTDSSRSLPR
jgi:DNA-binding transcriptional ArsR family regulator